MSSAMSRLLFLTLAVSAAAIIAAAGCLGGDTSETATPEAAVQRADTGTPSQPAGGTVAPRVPTAADTPAPTQTAAKPKRVCEKS